MQSNKVVLCVALNVHLVYVYYVGLKKWGGKGNDMGALCQDRFVDFQAVQVKL